MKKLAPFLIVLCFIAPCCTSSSQQSSTSEQPKATETPLNATPAPEQLTPPEEQTPSKPLVKNLVKEFPADSLLLFEDLESLKKAFGDDVVVDGSTAILFPGTNKQAKFGAYSDDSTRYGFVEISSPSHWQLNNGMFLGMTWDDLAKIDGTMAIKRGDGYSGFVGKLMNASMMFRFFMPDEVTTHYKTEWVSFKDASPDDRKRVVVSQITLYYPYSVEYYLGGD